MSGDITLSKLFRALSDLRTPGKDPRDAVAEARACIGQLQTGPPLIQISRATRIMIADHQGDSMAASRTQMAPAGTIFEMKTSAAIRLGIDALSQAAVEGIGLASSKLTGPHGRSTIPRSARSAMARGQQRDEGMDRALEQLWGGSEVLLGSAAAVNELSAAQRATQRETRDLIETLKRVPRVPRPPRPTPSPHHQDDGDDDSDSEGQLA